MNKLASVLLLFIIISPDLVAQGNDSFRYQAVIQSENGQIIASRKVSFLVTILKSALNRERVFSEFHTTVTDEFGVVNLAIGKGNPIFKTFDSIKWASDEHFIKIEMDENGGSNFTLLGESQLMTVPYALHAKSADNVDDADADAQNEIQTLSLSGNELKITSGNAIQLPQQTLSLNGNKLSISNGNTVVLPTENSQAPNPEQPVPIIFRGSYIYAHPIDNADNVVFGPFQNTGATSDYDGKTNTEILVGTYGSGNYAAKICADLNAFGYDDWYLPSRAELDAIFKQSYLIADYTLEEYWTSSETANNMAYIIDMRTGQPNDQAKNQEKKCRCIRKE
ncbi:DUF1566 domain-containing protein [Fulvivirga sp. 29W222]|uniref:DUF1566 domain-containing protein n=1 Tax=Fulvivirga marina TaxID=2494733 RepID=A0A937KER1_9BACT|nr:DUF1566 domain-containing protein [Fulvivirga marina]MBL6447423.1 DUF1566 domain-containing protein [Fulvivirga marina]